MILGIKIHVLLSFELAQPVWDCPSGVLLTLGTYIAFVLSPPTAQTITNGRGPGRISLFFKLPPNTAQRSNDLRDLRGPLRMPVSWGHKISSLFKLLCLTYYTLLQCIILDSHLRKCIQFRRLNSCSVSVQVGYCWSTHSYTLKSVVYHSWWFWSVTHRISVWPCWPLTSLFTPGPRFTLSEG